jgi:hypothetical protein
MKCKFLVFALLLAAPTVAQTTASADAPASREEVRKLFEVMQVHQQMRQVMDSVMAQQKSMLHQTLKANNPSITAADEAHYDAMMAEMVKDMPLDGILDDMVPIYQKHFTAGDIAAMSAFYSSPTGQKMLHEMPQLTTEAMQASYGRMQKQMDAMMQKLKQIQKEEEQKAKAAAPAAAAPADGAPVSAPHN